MSPHEELWQAAKQHVRAQPSQTYRERAAKMIVNIFRIDRSEKSRSRKLPLLPRVGFVIDFAGRRFSFRHAPLIETLLNLIERGATRSNLEKIVTEQLYEISLPSLVRKKTVNVKARTISHRPRKLKSEATK